MEFRPCIDIHNGKVKQIIGGSLKDEGDYARENFVSEKDADFYADYYRERGIRGGHIILLNSVDSPYFEATKQQAMKALAAYPGGLQIGGGVNADNAAEYIRAGASHVIVTSYVFRDGRIDMKRLKELSSAVGKEHLVLDLSCRKRERKCSASVGKDGFFIVTDRWQKFTDCPVNRDTMDMLAEYCDEFLVHAVDVEGQSSGISEELLEILADWNELPITYAGGVRSLADVERIAEIGRGKINVTIGTALDLFGGNLNTDEIIDHCRKAVIK